MSHTFRGTILGTRIKTAGGYVNGEWVDGETEAISLEGSKQPLRPDEIQILPEGRREFQAYKIYTDFQLQISDKTTGINADILAINGEAFEVISVEPFQSDVVSHYKAIAVKL